MIKQTRFILLLFSALTTPLQAWHEFNRGSNVVPLTFSEFQIDTNVIHNRYKFNSSAMQETLVQFLGREDPLEKGWLTTQVFLGICCGSAGKESTCNEGDLGLIPGLGRCPGGGSVANFPPGAWLGLCECCWPGRGSQWDLALQM